MQINPNALRMAKTPCAVGLINTALFLKKRQGPVLEQGHLLGYMIIVGGGGGGVGGGGGGKGCVGPLPPKLSTVTLSPISLGMSRSEVTD